MDKEFQEEWKTLEAKLGARFGNDMSLDGILFLIGVQELGKGYVKLKKDEKLEVMHIAICRLLQPYGFYRFLGRDRDGWPHYERTGKLPHLQADQQHQLIREAILDYFREN